MKDKLRVVPKDPQAVRPKKTTSRKSPRTISVEQFLAYIQPHDDRTKCRKAGCGYCGFIEAQRSMLQFKAHRIQDKVEEAERSQGSFEKYALSEWEGYLRSLDRKVSTKSKGKSTDGTPDDPTKFLTKEHLWEILDHHYPEVMDTRKKLILLKSLKRDVDEQMKKAEAWAKGNIAKLVFVLETARDTILGRERELGQVLAVLKAFIGKWQTATTSFLNIMLLGPAGSGKTEFAKLIAKIFQFSGILFRGEYIEAGRPDFVGQYLGQSAPQTVAKLNSALESVLFIDEAYALAKCDKPLDPEDPRFVAGKTTCGEWESYSNEAVTAMLNFLSEHKGQIVVITAGYEHEMKNLEEINEGVSRRFPHKIVLSDYEPEDLLSILQGMLRRKGFVGQEEVAFDQHALDLFRWAADAGLFVNQAGDMDNLASAISTMLLVQDQPKPTVTGCQMLETMNTLLESSRNSTIWTDDSAFLECLA